LQLISVFVEWWCCFQVSLKAITGMAVTMEISKLVAVGFLAAHWKSTGVMLKLALLVLILGLALINAVGVFSQLVAAHFGDRVIATNDVETEAAALASRISVQAHNVDDLDLKISQLDNAVSELVKRGRVNGALDTIREQKKSRADLVAQRQREADGLSKMKAEQAATAGRMRAVEVEAAPIMYVAQLAGATSEQAIRLLILLMVLTCDPTPIVLTAAASARR